MDKNSLSHTTWNCKYHIVFTPKYRSQMDDCAEDYRQTDQHPIAAMNSENYEVPPACVLPDRMNEYYDFLQKPDIHPLIKAAVAQAYLLVTRPFPEGNERLSRMMSSAVLLRSGYDFFRDISISSVIARESYRYYKSMCEIIRSENGGDLTSFLQYYLELLVRALDVRNERQRKREEETREREEEALRRERELARQPLAPMVQPCEEDIIDYWGGLDDEDGTPLPKPPEAAAEDAKRGKDDSPLTTDSLQTKLIELEKSRSPLVQTIVTIIHNLQGQGINTFTCNDWTEYSGLSAIKARDSHGGLYCKFGLQHVQSIRRPAVCDIPERNRYAENDCTPSG